MVGESCGHLVSGYIVFYSDVYLYLIERTQCYAKCFLYPMIGIILTPSSALTCFYLRFNLQQSNQLQFHQGTYKNKNKRNKKMPTFFTISI